MTAPNPTSSSDDPPVPVSSEGERWPDEIRITLETAQWWAEHVANKATQGESRPYVPASEVERRTEELAQAMQIIRGLGLAESLLAAEAEVKRLKGAVEWALTRPLSRTVRECLLSALHPNEERKPE